MSFEKPYKRRIVFINKRYQVKFIFKFCLIILAGGFISTILVFLLSRGTLTTSFEHGRLMVRSTAWAILSTVILTNLITVAIVSVITVVTVLYISHKIAGPMFRFEKEMIAVKEGNLSKRISLRKEDQFVSLSNTFNDMVQSLHQNVITVDAEIKTLRESLTGKKDSEAISADLERIAQLIQSRFQLY